ncbi:hypothetical protein [Leptospira noguchii]|nr:hypothetical protein [Leptospira noguchii]
MKRRTLEEIALSWAPEDGDRYGEDKKKFIRKIIYLRLLKRNVFL